MNQQDFEKLLYGYLDGELDPRERQQLENHLASSAEAREILAFEEKLRDRCVEALQTSADLVRKGQLLQNFRDAVAEKPPLGRVHAFPWRTWTVPAAAVLFLALSWMGGLFDGNGPISIDHPDELEQASRDIISAVGLSEASFRHQFSEATKNHNCPYRCIKESLGKDKTNQFWAHDSTVAAKARFEAAQSIFVQCFGKKLALPCLPNRLELVAARKTSVKMAGKNISLPHLILMDNDKKVSVYIVAGEDAKEITKGLAKFGQKGNKKNCLHGCPHRGIVVRQCGEAWMVLLSDMKFDDLRALTQEI